MDATSVWLGRELAKKIADMESTITRTLTSGAAADYADYRFIAGQLNGLKKVRDWIKDADPDERRPYQPNDLTGQMANKQVY